METALAKAAARNKGLVFVGGQGNVVTLKVAAACLQKRLALVQGDVTSPNLSRCYSLREQSAFLAGCLAARMTKTGIVGHLSDHRF